MDARNNFGIRWLILLACLSTCSTASSQTNKRQPVDAIWPVGSTTYFLTCFSVSDSPPDIDGLIPATIRSTGQMLRHLEREERNAQDKTTDTTNHWYVYHFTITAWSDHTLETSPIVRTTPYQAQLILDRLDRLAPSARPTRAIATPRSIRSTTQSRKDNTETKTQCTATTKRGSQCSRNAKEDTGLCWQHQNSNNASD